MRNTGLDEAQAGIKTARRNINNLRYANDTTPMAEREEELESLLMKVKEESEKVLMVTCVYLSSQFCAMFFHFFITFLVRLSYLTKASNSICPLWFLHLCSV